jgi:hypothetical protein
MIRRTRPLDSDRPGASARPWGSTLSTARVVESDIRGVLYDEAGLLFSRVRLHRSTGEEHQHDASGGERTQGQVTKTMSRPTESAVPTEKMGIDTIRSQKRIRRDEASVIRGAYTAAQASMRIRVSSHPDRCAGCASVVGRGCSHQHRLRGSVGLGRYELTPARLNIHERDGAYCRGVAELVGHSRLASGRPSTLSSDFEDATTVTF